MSEDAFLTQRLEFLEAELGESKAREANLKKMNDSLVALVNQSEETHLQEHTLSELQKVTEHYTKEIEALKARHQVDSLKTEKEARERERKIKEMELDLKHTEVIHEREKLELREVVQQLEADKVMLSHTIKSLEEERSAGRDNVKYDLELKLHTANRELSIQKEEARTELLKAREAADKTVAEMKEILTRKNEDLKLQVTNLTNKIKKQHEKIMILREGNESEALYREIEKLQAELDTYRLAQKAPRYPTQTEEESDMLLHQVEQLQYQLRQRESPNKMVEALRRENDELKSQLNDLQQSHSELKGTLEEHTQDLSQTEELLYEKERELEEKTAALDTLSRELGDSRQRNPGKGGKRQCTLHWTEDRPLAKQTKTFCDTCSTVLRESQGEESLRRDLGAKERKIQDLQLELERTQLQRDRALVEHDRALLELKHMKMEWTRGDERRSEKEQGLKNEVKYLIGKLLKAKGKHAAETELNETMKKEGTNRTLRPRSTARLRNSPLRRPISPLNLSAISRTESPFGVSELDMY